jgi:predicted DNA-binding ribbon-helix-helix protein
MFNSFLDGSKPSIECTAVSNATGLSVPSNGLLYPPASVEDIPFVTRPVSEGDVLERKGMVVRRVPDPCDNMPLPGVLVCANILVSKHQYEAGMSRLTITLSEARYRALKEASAQRDKTIGQLIDESLDFYGIKSRQDASDLVRRARARSKLTEDQALAVAQEQIKAVRRKP